MLDMLGMCLATRKNCDWNVLEDLRGQEGCLWMSITGRVVNFAGAYKRCQGYDGKI